MVDRDQIQESKEEQNKPWGVFHVLALFKYTEKYRISGFNSLVGSSLFAKSYFVLLLHFFLNKQIRRPLHMIFYDSKYEINNNY